MILAGVFTVLVVFVLVVAYQRDVQQVAMCTQETMQCPDGSFVSRTAPLCKFAQCPPFQDEIASWNTATDTANTFSLKYPDNFFDEGREPKITVHTCSVPGFPASCPSSGELRIVNAAYVKSANPPTITVRDRVWCAFQSVSAATGHVYYEDYYATVHNGQCLVVTLATSTANCDFYLPLEPSNEEQAKSYQACVAKNTQRPQTLSRIISTFTFK